MIPKKIFQTSKTKIIPEKYREWVASWVKFNSDYNHVCFDNQDNKDYIRSYFPEYFDDFYNFPCEIHRTDFIRYLYLYKEGGIYADIDFECLRPFNKLLEENKEYDIILGSISPNSCYTIPNAIMLSKPNIKFWLDLTETIINNFRKKITDKVNLFAGSTVLGKTFKQKKKEYKIKIMPINVFYPFSYTDKCNKINEADMKKKAIRLNSYAVHYWMASWKDVAKLETFIFKNKI